MLYSGLVALCARCQIDALQPDANCHKRWSCLAYGSFTGRPFPAWIRATFDWAYQFFDAPSLAQGQQACVEV